jgi:FMN phosphatase YigB (HAD superfamily)
MSNPKRVLFIGNSITRHEPAPDIGWYGSWGMAASCEKNDYAHVIISKFEEAGLPIEYKIKNIADFERAFWNMT